MVVCPPINHERETNLKDQKGFEFELPDCVYSSYFRHNFESFDRYCTLIENGLGDFHEGPYEYGNVCLKKGDVVFDCGANRGLFSAVASRYGCQVYAFEAIPNIIDNYLSKTASMNRNIRTFNFAVWDKMESLDFSFVIDHIGASRCNQLFDDTNVSKERMQLIVPAITLDSFVEQNGVERIDFVKADIEGAERNMLRGAKKILNSTVCIPSIFF